MFGFVAASAFAVIASKSADARIQSRLDDETAKAKNNGLDLADLYYDFDVPGDAYPFGDAEGMDYLPKGWKPPRIGDAKYLPTKMLGQIELRNKQHDAIAECKERGIDVSDVCVPFVDYTGPFDTNQKRYNEIKKRLEASKKK